MKASGSYNASTYHRDLDSELQRLQFQVELTWRKESRNLLWFGVEDGMSVLELGCGPGFTTEKLLTLLPGSTITSVDLDSLMIQQLQQYLPPHLAERVNPVEASATATGLPDSCMDVAIARLLFQHVPNPAAVAAEAFRVLKPGGKLIITDVDGDLFWLLDPPRVDTDLISKKLTQGQAAQGGDRQIGRKLWRLLATVGFQNLELELIAAHSDELGMSAFLPQFDPDLLQPLVKVGLLSDAQLEEIRQSRDAFLSDPHPLALLMWFMVCGTKP